MISEFSHWMAWMKGIETLTLTCLEYVELVYGVGIHEIP